MQLNNKKSMHIDPIKNQMNPKPKTKKHKDVSPNHFFKKLVNEDSDFGEAAPRVAEPMRVAPQPPIKAEVTSESKAEEEE